LLVRHSIPGDARPPGPREPALDRRILPTRVANPVRRDFDLASVLARSTNELNPNFKRLSTAIRPSMAVPSAAMP